jgi:hypothetical protein
VSNNFLKEKINDLLLLNSGGIEEYQDKFYFVKNLKSFFPELAEDNIYKAIESANKSLTHQRKKKDYINLLINKLLNFDVD